MDAQTTLAQTAALIALVQSVPRLELEEGFACRALVEAEEVLAVNRLLAARDGVEGALIDVRRQERRPVRALLGELVDAARPHARVIGCEAQLELTADLVAAPGCLAQRARGADGDLAAVVADIADRFHSL